MARRPNGAVKLNLRFEERLRQKLERSAEKRNISLNSEILNRIEQSFEWDRTHGEVEKLLSESRKAVAQDLEGHLRAVGFTPIATANGYVWLSPGMDPLKVAVWTDPTEFQKRQESAMREIFREIVRAESGKNK